MSAFGKMTKKEFVQFLLDKGFMDIGGDSDGEMYVTNDISVFVSRRGKSANLSFGHSGDGYYGINNPSFEQINSLIDIFSVAKLEGFSEGRELPKKQFLLSIIDYLKRHIT